MRGAPQSRLAMLIWRMRSRISVLCSSWADPEAGSRSPAPIEPEALAIPLDHGRRLHQYHRVQGRRPDDFEDTRGCVEPQLAHGVGPYIASGRRIRVLGVVECAVKGYADHPSTGHLGGMSGEVRHGPTTLNATVRCPIGALIFWCPTTRQEIKSGVHTDEASLAKVRSLSVQVYCPACKTTHLIRAGDGWVGGDAMGELPLVPYVAGPR